MTAKTPKRAMVRIYSDGGARGNPGPAAIGVVICDHDDVIIKPFGEYIGRATNNEAEYRALIRGLEIAAKYTDSEIICTLDSELVVRQMIGEYRAKEPRMRRLMEEASRTARQFRHVKFVNLPRMTGHLALADRLVNETLDGAHCASIDEMLRASITKEVEIDSMHDSGVEQVDPSTISLMFIEHCLRQGWIVKKGSGRGSKYHVTETGKKELRKFGISI
jgi:ribonuclease HI